MKVSNFINMAVIVACFGLTGCDTTESTMGGAALGTAAGAGIGYAFGGKGGAVAGGLIGGLGGGAAGHAVARKKSEGKERAAYVEENARLRAQNAALLDSDYRKKCRQNCPTYTVDSDESRQQRELQQLNFEIEKARLENERLKYELERENMYRQSNIRK